MAFGGFADQKSRALFLQMFGVPGEGVVEGRIGKGGIEIIGGKHAPGQPAAAFNIALPGTGEQGNGDPVGKRHIPQALHIAAHILTVEKIQFVFQLQQDDTTAAPPAALVVGQEGQDPAVPALDLP